MNFGEFMNHIEDYESDTFSASAEKISVTEKIKIANKLLDIFVNNNIDGVLLSQVLQEIREEGKHE